MLFIASSTLPEICSVFCFMKSDFSSTDITFITASSIFEEISPNAPEIAPLFSEKEITLFKMSSALPETFEISSDLSEILLILSDNTFISSLIPRILPDTVSMLSEIIFTLSEILPIFSETLFTFSLTCETV